MLYNVYDCCRLTYTLGLVVLKCFYDFAIIKKRHVLRKYSVQQLLRHEPGFFHILFFVFDSLDFS